MAIGWLWPSFFPTGSEPAADPTSTSRPASTCRRRREGGVLVVHDDGLPVLRPADVGLDGEAGLRRVRQRLAGLQGELLVTAAMRQHGRSRHRFGLGRGRRAGRSPGGCACGRGCRLPGRPSARGTVRDQCRTGGRPPSTGAQRAPGPSRAPRARRAREARATVRPPSERDVPRGRRFHRCRHASPVGGRVVGRGGDGCRVQSRGGAPSPLAGCRPVSVCRTVATSRRVSKDTGLISTACRRGSAASPAGSSAAEGIRALSMRIGITRTSGRRSAVSTSSRTKSSGSSRRRRPCSSAIVPQAGPISASRTSQRRRRTGCVPRSRRPGRCRRRP